MLSSSLQVISELPGTPSCTGASFFVPVRLASRWGGDVLENRAVAREIRNRLADSRDDVRDLAGDIPQRIRDENLVNNGRERDAVPALPPAI